MARVFGAATTLLLFSTGLPNYSQGSLSSHDDNKVFPDFDFEGFRGQIEKVRAQALKLKDVPPASAGTAANVGRPRGDQARPDIPVAHLTPLSEMVQGSALNTNSRNLQEGDCSDGATSLSVTSSVFPFLEGCLSPDGFLGYSSATGRIWSLTGVSSPDDSSWVANYVDSSGEFTLACFTLATVELVDPSEAAWFCDADGDGAGFVTLADDEFSVSCGCSVTSPSPMVTDAPAPSTTVSACGDGDSFSIVSETLPVTEGCYLGTGFAFNDEVLYTTSGTNDFAQIWVVANVVTGVSSSTSGNVHWFIVDVAASGKTDDSDFFCSSAEEAALYHPWEVPTWRCVEGVSIEVACGCSSSTSTGTSSISPTTPTPITQPTAKPTAEPASTPAPIPTSAPLLSPGTPTPIAQPKAQPTAQPASTPAPSPVAANEPELTASTCPGDGSFRITANAAPNMDGCFTATTSSDGQFGYTVSGTATVSEFAVFPFQFDDGDFKWIIAFLAPDAATQQFCSSVESASDVTPANASWICDFTGDFENLSLASNEDISIVCGSCVPPVPGGATSEASPACKSGVGAVAVGGAGMVAVASAFAAWC